MSDQFVESSLPPPRPAWVSMLLIIATIFAGFVIIGPLIGILVSIPFMDEPMMTFLQKMTDPADHPEIKVPLIVMQSVVTFFGLAVLPALYWYAIEKKNPIDLLKTKGVTPLMVIVTIGIVIFCIAPNSVLIDWNAHVKFPAFMHGFEEWARKNEVLDEQLVKLFTTFDSFGQFLFGFLTIAILAGFSEELVFRGMLQPTLQKVTRSPHAAIWITAFLFSAMHLQFFGFFPRLVLGALFGYLYYWSGNLILPIIGHMVNNGLSVILIYLYQLGKIEIDVDSTDAFPWPAVIVGTIFFAALLVFFHRFYKNHNSALV